MQNFKFYFLVLTVWAVLLPSCRDCKDESCPGVGFVRIADECTCPEDRIMFSEVKYPWDPDSRDTVYHCQEIGDNDYYGILPDTMDERFWRDTFLLSIQGEYEPNGGVVDVTINGPTPQNGSSTSFVIEPTQYGYFLIPKMGLVTKSSNPASGKPWIRYNLTYENVRLYPNDSLIGTLRFESHFTWEVYKVHGFVMRGKNYRR